MNPFAIAASLDFLMDCQFVTTKYLTHGSLPRIAGRTEKMENLCSLPELGNIDAQALSKLRAAHRKILNQQRLISQKMELLRDSKQENGEWEGLLELSESGGVTEEEFIELTQALTKSCNLQNADFVPISRIGPLMLEKDNHQFDVMLRFDDQESLFVSSRIRSAMIDSGFKEHSFGRVCLGSRHRNSKEWSECLSIRIRIEDLSTVLSHRYPTLFRIWRFRGVYTNQAGMKFFKGTDFSNLSCLEIGKDEMPPRQTVVSSRQES